MNASIEKGFVAVLKSAWPDVHVREATSSAPLPANLQLIVVECPEVEHVAGPLHRATMKLWLGTPAFEHGESEHRQASSRLSSAFADPAAATTAFDAAASRRSHRSSAGSRQEICWLDRKQVCRPCFRGVVNPMQFPPPAPPSSAMYCPRIPRIANARENHAGTREINEDSQTTSDAFAAMGLSMADLRSLSPSEQFAQVSAALAGISNPADRAALAMALFGRKGAELMALFKDSSAMSVAAQQVGGLAAAMDANANRFDFISDAFGAANLKGQQLAAGITEAIAPALEEIALALNEADMTGLGQSLGQIAAAAVGLGQALSGMVPQIFGVVVAMTLFRAGFDAKVITAMGAIGPAATRSFAQVKIAIATTSFSSLATGARTAFAGVAVAARGAALAIKGALISTGVGALVVGLGMAIESVLGKINRVREAANALNQVTPSKHLSPFVPARILLLFRRRHSLSPALRNLQGLILRCDGMVRNQV